MKSGQFILSILVANHFGVLTRVSGLFSRRSFNIDSLSVGETENPEISRITIVATGDDYTKDQVVKQLSKLHEVKCVEIMDEANTVVRELIIIKIKTDHGKQNELLEAVNIFRGKVVDLSSDSISVEITGDQSKVDAFIEYAKPYGILELCRTGATALGRGNSCIV